MSNQQWLTVKEFAALKGVTAETVRRWIRSGLIPQQQIDRMGKRGRIRIKDAAAA